MKIKAKNAFVITGLAFYLLGVGIGIYHYGWNENFWMWSVIFAYTGGIILEKGWHP